MLESLPDPATLPANAVEDRGSVLPDTSSSLVDTEPGTSESTIKSTSTSSPHEGVGQLPGAHATPSVIERPEPPRPDSEVSVASDVSNTDRIGTPEAALRKTEAVAEPYNEAQLVHHVPLSPAEACAKQVPDVEVIRALETMENIMRQPDVAPVPLSAEACCAGPTLAIVHRLISFRDLRFLWPQVVRRCGSREKSVHKIKGFLDSYADGLRDIAVRDALEAYVTRDVKFDDALRECVPFSASKIIRTAGRYLAERIVDVYKTYLPVTGAYHVQDRVSYNEKGEKGVIQVDGDALFSTAMSVVLPRLEACLYETGSIEFLQENIKSFIALPRVIGKRVWAGLTVPAENVISKLRRPPVREGMKRITWTCRCGRDLYDDYVELRVGAADELETQLRRCGGQGDKGNAVTNASNPADPPQRSALAWRVTLPFGIIGFYRTIRSYLEEWRHSLQRPKDIELGLHSETNSQHPQRDPHYVLLCVPYQRWAMKLHQPRVCHINSDQDLFQVLRQHYYVNRGSSRWKRLRKVQSLDFVKFETYQSQLVDVQARPSLPSDAMSNHYTYDPMPAEIMPPIGPNLLMHLFENPEDAEVLPVLFRKIPKKVRFKLTACSVTGSSVGWGLQFVEGMNWIVFLVYGSVGFVLALLAALVWVALRSDVQGAFAIAGYMITFLLFCAGVSRADVQG